MPRPVPPALAAVAGLVVPPLRLLVGRRWSGGEHVPPTGGFVVASNHVSNLDPLLVGDFLQAHGAPPAFLAKSELFTSGPVGRILRAAGQVEVRRDAEDADRALDHAREALADGRCVVVYPEGTFTRDPDLWPMTGRNGAVRLALEAGVPIVPVVSWGGQRVLPPFTSRFRPLPRTTAEVVAGRPMGRAELLGDGGGAGRESHGVVADSSDAGNGSDDVAALTPEALTRATDRVMDRLAAMLSVVRGEPAPEHRWDTRVDGDPHPRRRTAR
ncbi:lysophospholipid acyltransferase family protein [Georgenia sp. Z1344]|uniref:lysophospholipid acyltransferase family protein n=1 Tax=Georgenia sp. Z1344 TaxID=3416706 RepID=UPI003CF41535